VRKKSLDTVIVRTFLSPHLCIDKTSKYLSQFKTKKNEKANSNRNTDSKWWWVEIQLINGHLFFFKLKKPNKMKKLTATETQTVNGGGPGLFLQ
jgi:hypothetical protein